MSELLWRSLSSTVGSCRQRTVTSARSAGSLAANLPPPPPEDRWLLNSKMKIFHALVECSTLKRLALTVSIYPS